MTEEELSGIGTREEIVSYLEMMRDLVEDKPLYKKISAAIKRLS